MTTLSSDFASLHLHTQYSPLDSIASSEDYLRRAKELGIKAVSCTDHGRLPGHRAHLRAFNGSDIKPILGIEAYFSSTDRFDKRTKAKRTDGTSIYDHLVIHATGEGGLKNLNKMNAEAWQTGYYHQPRIDKELLEKYGEGLIITSACMSGPIAKPIREGNVDLAYERAGWFKKQFGPDFYIEVMTENEPELNQALLTLSDDLEIKPVLTEDCHYVWPEDLWIEEAFLVLSTRPRFNSERSETKSTNIIEKFNNLYGKERSMTFQDLNLYMAGPDIRRELMAEQGITRSDIIENTMEIADKVGEYPYFQNLNLLPKPPAVDPQKKLEKDCRAGLAKRGLIDQESKDRLESELLVIKEKGFAPYLIIVADLLRWARKQGIRTGFGRGSAAGSMMCYALEITEVNPLEHRLLFSRFIDESRPDWPDIDIDVQDNRREEVKEYARRKYGNVANIATKNMFKGKNSLKDAASILGISFKEANGMLKGLDPEHAFDQYGKDEKTLEFHNKYPDVLKLAKAFEGRIKNAGMHPGGLIISKEPIDDYVPVETVKDPDDATKRVALVAYDLKEVEDIGFIKIDLLGVKFLTVVDDCIRAIKDRRGVEINLLDIPINDPKVYKMLSEGRTKGVFQAKGPANHKWILETGVTKFEDLVIGTAIARPGPMDTVGEIYKRRLRGAEKVTYAHPVMEEFLSGTLGVVVFQEDVMQLLHHLGGIDMVTVNKIRRVLGKKLDPALIQEYKQMWLDGVADKLTERQGLKLWSDVEEHTKYSFNRAHAVAYSYLTNATAWLKYHFPLEYMFACLKNEKDKDERTDYLIEAKRLGIKILMPHVNSAAEGFTIDGEDIRFGLTSIKYISEKTVKPLLKHRPFKNYKELLDLSFTPGSGISSRTIGALNKIGAAAFDDNPQPLDWRDNLYEYLGIPGRVDAELPPKIEYQLTKADDYDESEPAIAVGLVRKIMRGKGWSRIEFLNEDGVISFFAEEQSPLDEGKSYCVLIGGKSLQRHLPLEDLTPDNDHAIVKWLKIDAPMCEEGGHYVLSFRTRKTKAGKRMGTITYSDWQKRLRTCEVWPSDYPRAWSNIQEGNFYRLETEMTDSGTRFLKDFS